LQKKKKTPEQEGTTVIYLAKKNFTAPRRRFVLGIGRKNSKPKRFASFQGMQQVIESEIPVRKAGQKAKERKEKLDFGCPEELPRRGEWCMCKLLTTQRGSD